MFRSILVPVDTSTESANAEQLAHTIAHTTGGTVHTLALSNVEFSPKQIVRAAASQEDDLIVLGKYGEDPLECEPTTSLAQEVVVQSPCPVLVAPTCDSYPEHLRTLLVPIDGSPGGSLALAAARALAEPSHASIVLLDVVVPVPAAAAAALPGMTLGGYIDPDWEQLARVTAVEYVEGISHRLSEAGLHAEAHVRIGDVGEEVVSCATEVDADLIVMSTHAVLHPASARIGSVADFVLRNAKRPVLLVKREQRPD